jgi:hypothetical protein
MSPNQPPLWLDGNDGKWAVKALIWQTKVANFGDIVTKRYPHRDQFGHLMLSDSPSDSRPEAQFAVSC